ncbi:MAG: DUF4019 domain-containing protein [Hyphomonadaceae bacterium]|nr:DUF4019 domain-containing protein [Hyphomonadaceae bacterium]
MKPLILALLAMFTFAASAAAQTQDARVAAAATARDAFWQALERNDLASARAMWTEDMQAEQTEEDFVADAGRLRRQTGAVIERRVMRTTIYDNTPGAPAPGVYIAFDIVARFENVDRFCGYIIMHQASEGQPFRVSRIDQTMMENSAAAAWDGQGQTTDQAWQQLATQFCPGWQPSWAIAPPV